MTRSALDIFIAELHQLANATDDDADKMQGQVAGDVARGAAWVYRQTARALEKQLAARKRVAA